MSAAEEDLIDYSDEEIQTNDATATGAAAGAAGTNGHAQSKGDLTVSGSGARGSYVGIHSTSFRDMLLKPELMRAIADCGFEHPSEVQQVCIPQAILGADVICQAKSGLGKTAVFVLATLQQIEPIDGEASVLVMCHTRELAFQIRNEYSRFSKYIPNVRTTVFYGGTPLADDIKVLSSKETHPHIIVATPGRLNALVRDKHLRLGSLRQFVLDECDKMLEQIDMRRDVQDIFRATPTQKQVMMFSATLSQETRPICKKFMKDPLEIYIDDEEKLTLHGLQQFVIKTTDAEKNRKLNDLLDTLVFNQVIIFVSTIDRAKKLDALLQECGFPSITIHGGLGMEERIKRYTQFKDFQKRICVSTDVMGRGIDIERINVAINYDLAGSAPAQDGRASAEPKAYQLDWRQYLHRVGRAGRFGTKGLAISFVKDEADQKIIDQVEDRLKVKFEEFPAGGIDSSSYMQNNE